MDASNTKPALEWGDDMFTVDGRREQWDYDGDNGLTPEESPMCAVALDRIESFTVREVTAVAQDRANALGQQMWDDFVSDEGRDPTTEEASELHDWSAPFRCAVTVVSSRDLSLGYSPLWNDVIELEVEWDEVRVLIRPFLDSEVFNKEAIGKALEAMLATYGGRLMFAHHEDAEHQPHLFAVTLALPASPDQQLGHFHQIGMDAKNLLDELNHGPMTANRIVGLVGAGSARALIGQRESDVLDAKGGIYRLDQASGSFDLAKDVSAFANSTGGVILLGATTSNEPSGERITAVDGLTAGLLDRKRHYDVIARRVYPAVEGLRIDTSETLKDGREIVTILVPEQPAESKPFVVRRGKEGERDGDHIAVYERHDDHCRPVPPERLHTLLAAGRALLRPSS